MKLKLGNTKRALLVAVAWSAASGLATAQNFISTKAEAEQLLKGATLIGIYLRTESAYTLKFGTDGSLTDTGGAQARWWVPRERSGHRRAQRGKTGGCPHQGRRAFP